MWKSYNFTSSGTDPSWFQTLWIHRKHPSRQRAPAVWQERCQDPGRARAQLIPPPGLCQLSHLAEAPQGCTMMRGGGTPRRSWESLPEARASSGLLVRTTEHRSRGVCESSRALEVAEFK